MNPMKICLTFLACLMCLPNFARAASSTASLPDTSKMNLLFIIIEDCYSYMELKNGPVPAALYDLRADPWETVNLANDPAYANARAEMAALLKAGWKAALPPSTKAAPEKRSQ